MTKAEGGKVLIVPVDDYSFSKAKEESFYAFPKKYNRNVPKYIAFYRISPVSAVTHIAKVREVKKESVSEIYKMLCFGDYIDSEPIVVKFKWIRPLENKVKCEGGKGIRGTMYTTLKDLKEAKNTKKI